MANDVNRTFHLAEEDLDDFQAGCVICGSEDRHVAGSLQQAPEIKLLSCRACGVVSASRIPTPATLSRFYGSYYGNTFYQSREEKVAVQIPQVLADHIRASVRRFLPEEPLAILDFGGGDGSVSAMIAGSLGRRCALEVVDYNPDVVARSPGPQVSIAKVATLKEVTQEGFDLVLASAVLEHLPYPRPILNDLLARILPGGILYIRTPYMVPLRRLAQAFGKTVDFTYPAHIHDMGSAFWERILVTLKVQDQFEIVISRPSVVETSFRQSFLRTLIAHALKAPWSVLGNRWGFVGGWEVFIRRKPA